MVLMRASGKSSRTNRYRSRTKGRSIMKRHVTGDMESRKRILARRTEVVGKVISPRGRQPGVRGMPSPHEPPAEGMPMSKQDYFLLSRAIQAFGYNAKRKILEIWFTSGARYQFLDVPQSVWESFKAAQSKGRYFHNYIYGHWTGKPGKKKYHPNYKYRKVR